jgi:hypothetical protein
MKILAISEIHLVALFRGPSAAVYKPPTTRNIYFGAYFCRKLANGNKGISRSISARFGIIRK